MSYPFTALFAAVTTLLTPRAGEARVGEVLGSAVASDRDARRSGAVHPLAQTAFGQFVIHEMGPFSAALLASGDVAAFERGLDDFIDGDLGDRFFAAVQTVVADGWTEEHEDASDELPAALEALRARLVQALGERHAANITEGLGSMLAVMSHAPVPTQAVLVEGTRGFRLSDLLSDVDVPVERRQAALAAMESTACYFAMLHMVAQERVVPSWLADELIQRWTAGQAAVLRQLEISGDRIASSRQRTDHLLANAGYEKLARRGAAESVDVWPPEVGNDD